MPHDASAAERASLALRTAVTVTDLSHVSVLRIAGTGALDLVDQLVPARLFVRENQMLQTLMLDDDARVLADVFVCQDEDSLILLTETRPGQDLIAHVNRVRRDRAPDAVCDVVALSDDHVLWGLDGPYAWELASELLGPDVLGMPYLSFLRVGEVVCFRAGKTGEYGYMLLVPASESEGLRRKLDVLAAKHDAGIGSLAMLDQAALENWHFTMRVVAAEADPGLTPIELQLQWRVHYDKPFIGGEALARRRTKGAVERVTCFTAPRQVCPLDRILLHKDDIGSVLSVGYSFVRQDWVGWALLRTKVAHPGIGAFRVTSESGLVEIETRSPPLLNNRSLHVDPHRHSRQTRAADAFPPLVLA